MYDTEIGLVRGLVYVATFMRHALGCMLAIAEFRLNAKETDQEKVRQFRQAAFKGLQQLQVCALRSPFSRLSSQGIESCLPFCLKC